MVALIVFRCTAFVFVNQVSCHELAGEGTGMELFIETKSATHVQRHFSKKVS
jgi:hypothetical protein